MIVVITPGRRAVTIRVRDYSSAASDRYFTYPVYSLIRVGISKILSEGVRIMEDPLYFS